MKDTPKYSDKLYEPFPAQAVFTSALIAYVFCTLIAYVLSGNEFLLKHLASVQFLKEHRAFIAISGIASFVLALLISMGEDENDGEGMPGGID